MLIRLQILFFLILFVFSSGNILCQSSPDVELWSSITIEKDFTENWSAGLEQELRTYKNVSEIDKFFTELFLSYKINSNFSLTGYLRYIGDQVKSEIIDDLTRYSFDLKAQEKLSFLGFNYRLRWQKDIESLRFYDPGEPYTHTIRHRAGIKYKNLRKSVPFLNAEVFRLYQLDAYPKNHKYRILAGTKFELNNNDNIKTLFGFEKEINKIEPGSKYIFLIGYNLML